MEQKICRNCIHYLAHYIIIDSKLRQIDGHCTNKKPNGRFRKTDNPCEYYTQRDLQKEKEEQEKSTIKLLSLIAERINDLMQILKEEKESRIEPCGNLL